MRAPSWAAVSIAVFATLFAACQDDSESSDSTSTTSSVGGGGSGGQAQGGSNPGSGGTGGASMSASGGAGGGSVNPCEGIASPTVVINEVVTGGVSAEYFEIWNPGSTSVDLSNYFVSDNSTYHSIAEGKPWAPSTNNAGTDFLVQFPPDTQLAPDGVLVVATGADFFKVWDSCPDFVMSASQADCNGQTIPTMVAPTNGGSGTSVGSMLSGSREMLILFCWGPGTKVVHDVDYVTWGDSFEVGTRVDKSAVAGYEKDTAAAEQLNAAAPANFESIERCNATETAEAQTGGNGVLGHDETSEDMATSFPVNDTPSPGKTRSCS